MQQSDGIPVLMWDRSVNFSCLIRIMMGQPTTESNERAGYFDLGPVDLGENARTRHGAYAGRYGI